MNSYELIRSRRKTIALEVTQDCRVLVRAPHKLPKRQIEQFLSNHADWIDTHLKEQRQRAAFAPTEAEISALKIEARALLPQMIAEWSQKMGVQPTGFKVTTARTRYGSCSARDSLCFSCFLMKQPLAAIELVVVHELCHIREKNHGPGFYALLEQYLPDHQTRKRMLRPIC